MSGQSEDDVWRSIVENYGERPRVEPLPPDPDPTPRPMPDEPAWFTAYDEDDERFVPPEPPPLPHPPPVRLVAWLGIFGAPAVLLVALVLAIQLPGLVGYALIGWFVGGFGYLVATMDREPRDPGDNGARI